MRSREFLIAQRAGREHLAITGARCVWGHRALRAPIQARFDGACAPQIAKTVRGDSEKLRIQRTLTMGRLARYCGPPRTPRGSDTFQ